MIRSSVNRSSMKSTRLYQPYGILFVFCLMVLMPIVSSTGCVRLASNLIYVFKGRDTPAEFNSLIEKKVAVIVSTSAGYHTDASSIVLARQVNAALATNVKKIKVVDAEDVDRVLHDQPHSDIDFGRLSRQLGVDYVIAIDVKNLQLHEGATLYRGRCECSLAVYKSDEGNQPVFRKQLRELVYPTTGIPVTEFEEAKFQGVYLAKLSQRIGRVFYPYDPTEDVASDAAAFSIEGF